MNPILTSLVTLTCANATDEFASQLASDTTTSKALFLMILHSEAEPFVGSGLGRGLVYVHFIGIHRPNEHGPHTLDKFVCPTRALPRFPA